MCFDSNKAMPTNDADSELPYKCCRTCFNQSYGVRITSYHANSYTQPQGWTHKNIYAY